MPLIIIIMKPNDITIVTDVRIVTLVLIVIPFFLTKESRCFLYIFVFTNQLCNFSEEFAKQNTVSKKNGTVGKIGRTIPTQPIPRDTQPTIMKMIFLSFKFALLGLFFVLRIFCKFSQSVKTFGTYYMFKFAGIGCGGCFINTEIFEHFTKHTITLVNAFGNLFA